MRRRRRRKIIYFEMGGRGRQTKTYFNKFMREFWANRRWTAFVFAAVITIIISKVVGDEMFVYAQATESGCFTLISACIWIGIFNSIQSICSVRLSIKSDHMGGLHISSYVIASAMCEFIICAVEAILMVIILYVIRGLPEESPVFGLFWLDTGITFFVVLLAADYMGLLVSSFSKNATIAMTVMPFVLILQMVMSGVLFVLEGTMEKVAVLTYSKWGMEAFGSISNINSLPFNASGVPVQFREVYDYSRDHIIWAWLYIGIIGLACIILTILRLEFIDMEKGDN